MALRPHPGPAGVISLAPPPTRSAFEPHAGGEPGPQYNRTFQQLLFTQHLFTIKCKLDSYKDEQKLSATVVKLRPLKGPLLVQECHALVNNIKKYLSA